MRRWVWVACLWAGAAMGASSKDEAEHQRLSAEMHTLMEKNAWAGVERAYQAMSAMKKVPMTADDHYLGGLAAMNLGDVNDARQRFDLALRLGATDEVLREIGMLYAAYGNVRITRSPLTKGTLVLVCKDTSFDPVARAAIERAQQHVNELGIYVGLLPFARYEIGGVTFDVVGEDMVDVYVNPGAARRTDTPVAP